MKSTAQRAGRASRPTRSQPAPPATLAATLADAPTDAPEFTLEAAQVFELQAYELDGKTVRRFMTWTAKLACDSVDAKRRPVTDVYLSVSSSAPADPNEPPKSFDLGKMVGGFFTLAEFRRAVAALNTLAASLPTTAIPVVGQ